MACLCVQNLFVEIMLSKEAKFVIMELKLGAQHVIKLKVDISVLLVELEVFVLYSLSAVI